MLFLNIEDVQRNFAEMWICYWMSEDLCKEVNVLGKSPMKLGFKQIVSRPCIIHSIVRMMYQASSGYHRKFIASRGKLVSMLLNKRRVNFLGVKIINDKEEIVK